MTYLCKRQLWQFKVIFLSVIVVMPDKIVAANFPNAEPYIISNSETPKIDGVLNDDVWLNAARISEFHQTRPSDHGVPSEKTEVQIARDQDFIYVAFKAFDKQVSKLVAKGLIQGQGYFSDERVAITLDTFNDRRNSYFFQVNPNSIRREALLGNDYFIDEWDAVWFAKSKVYDWGWAAEMAIPLKSIAFDPKAGSWGMNLTRISPRRGEDMAWSSIDRNTDPSAYGVISNMQGFDQGVGLEVNPSLSVAYSDIGDAGSSIKLEPSLTAFYNVTPFLTAGVTVNTDFSGTEVDERQVNLSRFSLFFPEKRDFFLRDASIFEFGNLDDNARPFFSRRIGLSDNAGPLDLETGLKVSGRAGDWNIGALAIKQEVAEPGADEALFVGRVTRNVFKESEVGLITTVGDPNSDSGNSLFGVDYTYRDSQFLGDQRLQTNLWFQESSTDGVNDDQRAYGARIAYPNDRFDGFVDVRRIEENFNPALGFVNRRGVSQTDGRLRYRYRLENKFFQWIGPRVQYFKSDRIQGGVQSERFTFNLLEGFSRGNDFFTVFVTQRTEGLNESFNLPGDIPVPNGIYKSDRYGFFIETGTQRTWAAELEVIDGDFFGGSRLFIAPEVEWRPNRHFFASVSWEQNDVKLPQGEFTSRLYSARANVAFNSSWAWLNLVQADNVSNTVSFNSRVRFQPRADREFFLVFNQTRDRVTEEILNSAIVFKAAFNFRM